MNLPVSKIQLASWRKHPVILSLVVLIIGLLTWGFWPQPVFVETVAVQHGPLTITIEEEGRTRHRGAGRRCRLPPAVERR